VIRTTLAAVLFASPIAFADPSPARTTKTTPPVVLAQENHEHQPANRTLSLTDDNRNFVPELHVAPGVPTTLILPLNVDKNGTRLADSNGLLYPLLVQANTAVVTPKAELAPGVAVPMSVALEDGTLLSFVIRSAPGPIDFQVSVEVHFTRNNAPESVESLKAEIAQLQSRIDELQSNSVNAAVAHVANLLLSQEPGTATARTFEGHRVHSRDKQSRLLVEASYVYRLFSKSYLLLTVENRDPSRVWVLDRAEVHLKSSSETVSIPVQHVESDIKSLPPEETARVVVVFDTPPQSSGQTLEVSLLEKAGARPVTLEVEP
jgi:hypothetical protein